jgi:uncharacterized membrane protein
MTRLRRAWTRIDHGDDGQLLLLVLVYALIAAALVTAVVDVSKAYLHRRSLVAAVDGAALAAANQPDLDAVYNGSGRQVLPLSEDGVREAVEQYVADARLAARFDDFSIVDVSTDGATVTVSFASTVRMPFVNLVVSRAGYHLDATARARSPLTR